MDPAGGQFEFLTGHAVRGQILTERLSRGSLSVREALHNAIQIGETLHFAHSRGIVHGALSPDSIALTDQGATLLRPTGISAARPEYRSPEQVLGEEPGSGTDIFAFGALLYEMITGRRAFTGTAGELDRAILESAVTWPETGPPVPTVLRETIASLTAKDKAQRRQRIQNAVTELKLVARFPARSVAAVGIAPSPRVAQAPRPFALLSRRVAAIAIVLLALAASSVAAALLLDRRLPSPVFKFSITAPEPSGYAGGPALSRDARYIVFSAFGASGSRTLWLRSLDALHAAEIPETDGGSEPFWSPDGRSIGFFANGSLLRIGRAGETRTAICSTEDLAGGGSWNQQGVILFAPGLARGIYRVSAAGSVPQILVPLDSGKGELAMLWPEFLPDSRHFVFFDRTKAPETTGVYIGTIDGAEHRLLFRSESNAVLAGLGTEKSESGYLLFMREGALVAQPFDLSRLAIHGEPVTVAGEIDALTSLSRIPVTASSTGVLAYQSAGEHTRQLVWMDRNGVQLGIAAAPGTYGIPRLSPDGNRLAVEKLSPDGGRTRIWLLNTEGGGATQLTSGPAGDQASPVWSPDGSQILFVEDRDGIASISSQDTRTIAAPEHILFRSPSSRGATDWSRDGRYVLFSSAGEDSRPHVWARSLFGRQASPIGDADHASDGAELSPDGQWIAYQSDESGAPEIYVQPFHGLHAATELRRRVSTEGGVLPRWSRDGAQLYYLSPDGTLMSAAVRSVGVIVQFAAPVALFHTRQLPNIRNSFDVSADGQRFLVNVPLEDATSSPVTIVTNWTANRGWR